MELVRAILKVRPELVTTVEAWNNEHTALHYAVFGRMQAMVRMLMECGADAHAGISPHTEATSAFTIAVERRYDEIAAIIREEEQRREVGRPTADEVPAELRRALLAEHGDAKLPDDGFGSGTVAEQLVGAAARGGDPEILQIALERVDWAYGDPRWYGALKPPLEFWNHWIGPWCHHEWDRSTYLTCFEMILERCGPPTRRHRFGTTILHEIVTMGDHVTAQERVAFATAALDAGARLDLRDDLLKSTPLGWACRWGREELVRLFLARGADPVEADAEPWATPLAWAEKKGHGAVAVTLREWSP